jgi:hypothetical protein
MDDEAEESLPYSKPSILWKVGDEGLAPGQMSSKAFAKQVGNDLLGSFSTTLKLKQIFAELGVVRCPASPSPSPCAP